MNDVLENIQLILKRRIGLDINTIGKSTIEQTVLQRMARHGIADLNEYYRLINIDATELNELIEDSVIPETWFFRDITPYEFIYKNISRHIHNSPGSIYKILSLPCSSGEEPYSLAMYLLNNNIPQDAFAIDASDVSTRAIEKAREGNYGNNSFRGKDYINYQSQYFIENNGLFSISDKIKNRVNFSIKNILKPGCLNQQIYDVIICRNLLIYFDKNTKKTAFDQLIKAMKLTGLLFIGHSEFGSVPSKKLVNTGSKNGFALKRTDNPELKTGGVKRLFDSNAINSVTNHIKAISSKVPTRQVSNFIRAITPAAAKRTSTKPTGPTIEEAIQLADLKQFDKAETICNQLLKEGNNNPETYYLLGLIEFSRYNINEAEVYFRKALYLNPKHYPSLSQMASLLKSRGDINSAELFKNRARRAAPENQDE